jgi:hypothetical protein
MAKTKNAAILKKDKRTLAKLHRAQVRTLKSGRAQGYFYNHHGSISV